MSASVSGAEIARAQANRSGKSPVRRFRLAPWAPVLVLIALCAVVTAINPNFLTFGNLVRVAQSAMIPLVLGLGATFVILMGSIDLSVEGVLTLGAVSLSLLVRNGANGNDLGVLGILVVLAAAQLGLGNAQIGTGRLFTTITAVVVGGTSLSGGQGSVLQTLVGVLIVSVLSNGMVLMGISPSVQTAVQGLLIIGAVALSIDRARARIVK